MEQVLSSLNILTKYRGDDSVITDIVGIRKSVHESAGLRRLQVVARPLTVNSEFSGRL